MPSIYDYESIDKLAGIRAQAGIDSNTQNFTLLEACNAARLKHPVTEKDLIEVVTVLTHWGIHWNTEKEVLNRLNISD